MIFKQGTNLSVLWLHDPSSNISVRFTRHCVDTKPFPDFIQTINIIINFTNRFQLVLALAITDEGRIRGIQVCQPPSPHILPHGNIPGWAGQQDTILTGGDFHARLSISLALWKMGDSQARATQDPKYGARDTRESWERRTHKTILIQQPATKK